MKEAENQIIVYELNETIRLDVRLENETVWLTQLKIAELFGVQKAAISKHIRNIYASGELIREATVSKMETVQIEGGRTVARTQEFFNLDVIIAVGYRVNSQRATQFRIWATQRLRDYIIKGVALNDERFKRGNSMNYFKDLLERIREIRLSERVFYQQIKDIYATSIDYNPNDELTLQFFKEVQNKLLWAVSGKTAAELIYYRANAELPMMGLTSTEVAGKVRKSDTQTGKNYLTEDEIKVLKLIVEQFLAFAEAQAVAHVPMYMKDWIEHLKMVLTMNRKSILEDAGRISHQMALQKADEEYSKYKHMLRVAEHLESIKELNEDLKRLQE